MNSLPNNFMSVLNFLRMCSGIFFIPQSVTQKAVFVTVDCMCREKTWKAEAELKLDNVVSSNNKNLLNQVINKKKSKKKWIDSCWK